MNLDDFNAEESQSFVPSIIQGEKINILTLDQLRNSRVETTYDGKIASEITGISAIDAVSETMDKHNLPFQIKKIWAINNRPTAHDCGISISTELEEKYGRGHTKSMLFKRLFATIGIDDGLTDDSSGNVVVSFHQQGVELAFGDNVHVCQNLCIYGGEVIRNYSMYGNRSIPWKNMIEILSHWMNTYGERRARNINISRSLRMIETSNKEVESFIGGLTLRAARHTTKKDILAPLTITQVYDMSKSTASSMTKRENDVDWNIPNAWELYNRITQQHKVETIDSSMILYQNDATFRLIKSHFDVKHEEIPIYAEEVN